MFRKSQSYIGVDIGSSSVKVVELRSVKGKPSLVNYGYSNEIGDFSGSKNLQLQIGKVAGIINTICDKANIQSKNAVAGLPSFAVFSSILNLTGQSKKDLATAVMWEAKKIIPLDLNEMVLDWKIIKVNIKAPVPVPIVPSASLKHAVAVSPNPLDEEGTGEPTPQSSPQTPGANPPQAGTKTEGDNSLTAPPDEIKEPEEQKEESSDEEEQKKVLITAAPKSLVKKYIEIFKVARLNLLCLETEIFSMVRSLVGNDLSLVALVDFGAINTDIAIIERGMPMFSRSLDRGGIMITKAIGDSLGVDFKRAEQFKFDISSSGHQDSSMQGVPKVIEEANAPIVNEIKYSLNSFQEKNNNKIEKIILSGGGANLSNMTDYLTKALDMKVIIGDPWARVVYPLDLRPVLDEIGPKMGAAVGLALREIE